MRRTKARGHSESAIKKRSLVVRGHRTSISLEDEFWRALKEIASSQDRYVGDVVAEIDARSTHNLSSTLRVFVLSHYRPERN